MKLLRLVGSAISAVLVIVGAMALMIWLAQWASDLLP